MCLFIFHSQETGTTNQTDTTQISTTTTMSNIHPTQHTTWSHGHPTQAQLQPHQLHLPHQNFPTILLNHFLLILFLIPPMQLKLLKALNGYLNRARLSPLLTPTTPARLPKHSYHFVKFISFLFCFFFSVFLRFW